MPAPAGIHFLSPPVTLLVSWYGGDGLNPKMNIWVIIPAAGSGKRMQAEVPKQYLPLLDRPIILHTLERLCNYPGVTGVLVGIAPDDNRWGTLSTTGFRNFLGNFTGGATRAQTVLAGLKALSARVREDDWVMVHDAVRPCIRYADLDKLVAVASASSDGALLALPVADTLKRADVNGRVEDTVSRAGLWRALTPQIFRFKTLHAALTAVLAKNEDITDDSLAVERLGLHPRLVEGSPENIKVTRPADLALAELFLKQQAGTSA